MNKIEFDSLKPGSVIKIINFNLQNKEGENKPVWMLYLGKDSLFDCPLYVYMHRHTSQIDHYKEGGSRSHHTNIIRLHNPPYTFFEKKECILDFDERPYSLDKENFFNKFGSKCELKGVFDEQKIREICKCIKRSRFYNTKQKMAIRTSLNNIGIININL